MDSKNIQNRRLNENIWFEINQSMLLWLANTDYGRDLLCIDNSFPKIVLFKKNCIHTQVDKNFFVADFRVGAKWANVIRHRWEDFKKCEEYYWKRFDIYNILKFPQNFGLLAALTLTSYPDPNPETTSVDGYVGRVGVDQTFANIRSGAGTNANNTSADGPITEADASITTNQYANLYRGIALFDTSSLGSNATISAATLSFVGNRKSNGLVLVPPENNFTIVVCSPATNTALVAADYNIANWTMTAQNTTDILYANFTTTLGTYNDFALNATGIGNVSKTGISKFGTVYAGDRTNSITTWGLSATSFIVTQGAETAGTTSDPKLVVTYTIIATSANNPSLGSSFGAGAAGGRHGF